MRKLLSLLIIPTLMGLTGFTQSAQAKARSAAEIEAGDPLVVQAPRGLNVRKKPNAQRIGAIPDGQMVFATGPAKKHRTGRAGLQYWLPIRYQNESNEWVNGWIYLRHTERTEIATPPAEEGGQPAEVTLNKEDTTDGLQDALEQKPAPAVAAEDQGAALSMKLTVNVNSRARFRASPSLSGRVLGRLGNDTNVEIIGRPRGEWIPIRVTETGASGWMHMSLLESDSGLNPLELADRHTDSGDKVDEIIKAHAEKVPTEGGHVDTCTSCGGGNGQKLEPIPQGTGKAYIYPVNASVRSRFGWRTDPITGQRKKHGGVDFSVSTGTSIAAIRGGKVVAAKTNCTVGNRRCGGGWGNYVIVDHGNGVKSVYAHLKSVSVRVGAQVSQGQTIAKSGNTGRSTGPHLHLEVHLNGTKVDPLSYIKR